MQEPPPRRFGFNGQLGDIINNPVDRDSGNASEAIVDIFIEPRASNMFGYPECSPDGSGLSIPESIPHEEFSNSAFGIWLCVKICPMDVSDQLL